MEDVLNILLGAIMVVAVFLGYNYFMGFLAKTGNMRFTRNGRTVFDPKSNDDLNESIGNLVKGTINTLDKVAKITGKKIEGLRKKQIEHIIIDSRIDTISKLTELSKLRDTNVINDEEFELLKKELLNKEVA